MTAALEGVELEGRLGLVAGSGGGKVRLSGILSPALLGLSGPPLLLQLRQEGGTGPVCVGMSGTEQQLSHLTNSTTGRSGCLGEGGEEGEGEMQFSAHRPAHLPAAWCSHGNPTTWRFQSDRDQWGTLLTEADRARVCIPAALASTELLCAGGVPSDVHLGRAAGRGLRAPAMGRKQVRPSLPQSHDPPAHRGGGGLLTMVRNQFRQKCVVLSPVVRN